MGDSYNDHWPFLPRVLIFVVRAVGPAEAAVEAAEEGGHGGCEGLGMGQCHLRDKELNVDYQALEGSAMCVSWPRKCFGRRGLSSGQEGTIAACLTADNRSE